MPITGSGPVTARQPEALRTITFIRNADGPKYLVHDPVLLTWNDRITLVLSGGRGRWS
ncbi:hypothetical protein ABIA39_009013 [Nocardia sp. GAS34]|uniref:hypothetical protein n=1 Tax=unclassified Nocardia TaxID=2637762 RepID=UPI003D1A3AD5